MRPGIARNTHNAERGYDEPGELWLRGPQQMLGYVHNDEANANAFVPSASDPQRFLKTGDIAQIDRDGTSIYARAAHRTGFVKLDDRLKDIIKYNGFQVVPSELEGVVMSSDLVADVAVAGMPDKSSYTKNELPWAFCVRNKGDDESSDDQRTKALQEFVNSRVAGYKKIRGVTWLSSLPKSCVQR